MKKYIYSFALALVAAAGLTSCLSDLDTVPLDDNDLVETQVYKTADGYMGVLAKCLRAYCIDAPDTLRYICTCRAGRRLYPALPNHKLNTMCDYLGIALDHHEAGSDSRACALLLKNYLDRGMEPERFIRNYDLARMRTL